MNSSNYIDNQSQYISNYFNELNYFVKMIGIKKMDIKELDIVIKKCLSILITQHRGGYTHGVIKTSNDYFRTACKFIQYFYGFNTVQEKNFKYLKFTCCEYYNAQYKTKNLINSIFNRDKNNNFNLICKCPTKDKIDDNRISKISEDKDTGITKYQITIERIIFVFEF